MTTSDLEAALNQTRRAARLLWAYQRRTADITAEVDRYLKSQGLQFTEWKPTRNKRPPAASTRPWSRWAWDFLPGLFTRTTWTSSADADGRVIRIDLHLDSDSGYRKEGHEPDPAAWDDADTTASSMQLYMWIGPRKAPWHGARVHANRHLDWGSHLVRLEAHTFKLRCLSVDLTLLENSAAVRLHLLDEIDAWIANPSVTI